MDYQGKPVSDKCQCLYADSTEADAPEERTQWCAGHAALDALKNHKPITNVHMQVTGTRAMAGDTVLISSNYQWNTNDSDALMSSLSNALPGVEWHFISGALAHQIIPSDATVTVEVE